MYNMTNFDRWKLWNRDSFSPDIFIEWSWLTMISSALQRRVWYDNNSYPQFPNMFVLFCGPPGCGKGLQLDQISAFLRHHKRPGEYNRLELATMKACGKTDDQINELVFPFAADSTTFESLTQEMVAATKLFKIPGGKEGESYPHASLIFLLDEFTSIFKKHSEDTVTFLLSAWNCKDYLRRTKNKGTDPIRNQCMNLIAGTTPTELMKIQRNEIIGTGFSARLLIVYAECTKDRDIKIPEPDDAQKAAREEILDWLKVLSNVYGVVRYSAEAEEYLRAWWKDLKRVRVNTHHKLDEYYVRKIDHTHKVIMAMHYSDPGFKELVPVETIKRAIALLERTEKSMHVALQGGGRNPLSPVAKSMCTYINNHPGVGLQELMIQYMDDANMDELNEIINLLQAQGLIIKDHGNQTYRGIKK